MRRLLGLPAPAKINLFLHVTGRRADGLHELQTLFQLISLADEIDLDRLDDDRLERAGDLLHLPEDVDLTLRAARLLKAATGSTAGARITVRKRIPAGAGLGGGSSDAATVLIGLNRLWKLGLDVDRLAMLGLQLGADVPVFLRGRTALGEGVGERLVPVAVPPTVYRLAWPGVEVPTRDIFTDPELTRNTLPARIRGFSEVGRDEWWAWIAGHTRNDLQAVAERRFPEVRELLRRMSGHHGLVRMSGSGGCCFAVVSEPDADDAQAGSEGVRNWLVEGLDVHPLQQDRF